MRLGGKEGLMNQTAAYVQVVEPQDTGSSSTKQWGEALKNEMYRFTQPIYPNGGHGACPTCGKCRCCDGRGLGRIYW